MEGAVLSGKLTAQAIAAAQTHPEAIPQTPRTAKEAAADAATV